MYKTFFGLTRNPFEISPDPYFLFATARHNEALASIVHGVLRHKGFIVVSGEVGTGKTLLVRCLLELLRRQRHRIRQRIQSLPFPSGISSLHRGRSRDQDGESGQRFLAARVEQLPDRASSKEHNHRADRGRGPAPGAGAARRNSAADEPRDLAAEATADRTGRTTGTRSEDGLARPAAAEAADCYALSTGTSPGRGNEELYPAALAAGGCKLACQHDVPTRYDRQRVSLFQGNPALDQHGL